MAWKSSLQYLLLLLLLMLANTTAQVVLPTGLSAVHTNSTTIRVYWTPPTATPTGYEITYFAGAEDTTGTAESVGGGSTSSAEILGLNATVTYRVSIVSVSGTNCSGPPVGPVLAARGAGLTLNGAVFPNHGVINKDPSVIGEDEDALYCVTDDVACCGTPPSPDCCGTPSSRTGDGAIGNGRGNWSFPAGEALLSGTANGFLWYVRWLTGAVLMNFRGTASTGTTGLHRCDILDSTDTLHQFYTCVYDNTDASQCAVTSVTSPLQFSLTADPSVFTLTCVSTGGPATTVTWTRDGAAVSYDATHVLTQIVTDQFNLVYSNVLTVTGREPGSYTCSVTNARTTSPIVSAPLTVVAPNDVRFTLDGTTITVTWTPPSPAPSNGYIVYYTDFYSPSHYSPARDEGSVSVSSGSASQVVINVTDIVYRVYVVAVSDLPSVQVEGVPDPYVEIFGQVLLPDHSLVDNTVMRLRCMTGRVDCCNSTNTKWYLPSGAAAASTDAAASSATTASYGGTSNRGAIELRSGNSESLMQGIHRCTLPESDPATNPSTISLYIGIYNSGEGAVTSVASPLQFSLQTTPTADPPVFTLTCVSTGGPATTVTWTRDGAIVSNDANHVFTKTVTDQLTANYSNTLTVTGREPGNYTCSVANNRTAPPATASLTVALVLPNITGHPVTQLLIVPQQPATFTVNTTGNGLVYQWQKDGGNISEANSTTYTIMMVAESDEGEYRCVVSNTAGSVNSTAARLTVLDPPLITKQPDPLVLVAEQPATITLIATGDNLMYQWQKDGVDIATGANSATYTIAEAAESDEGEYRCVVTNAAISVTSTAASLTVLTHGHGLNFNDSAVVNHGVVILDRIMNTTSTALLCVSLSADCCTATGSGDWFSSNDSVVTTNTSSDIYQVEGNFFVELRRSNGGVEGIYRCDIRLSEGAARTSFYVGLYQAGHGAPAITRPLQFSLQTTPTADPPVFTLSCVSTGGPATTVTWTRDGAAATGVTSQTVTDMMTATYTNTLTVTGREPGMYKCRIQNVGGFDNEALTVTEAAAPSDVSFTLDGPTITVTWTPPSPAPSNGYIVYYSATEDVGNVSVSSGSVSQAVIPGRQADRAYTVSVVALSAHLPSAQTAAVPATRPGSSVGLGVIVGIMIATLAGILAVIVVVAVICCLQRRGSLPCAEHPGRKKYLSYGSKIVRSEGVELKAVQPAAEKTKAKTSKGKPSKATAATVSSPMNAIPVSEFPDYVRRMNKEGFEDEYGTVPKKPQAESNAAVIPCNRQRNRFANTFPYDFNRVKLKAIEGEEGSDYINASFVDGYIKKQQYIAAQGPMPQSLADFLRLIWEQHLPTVVMVTQCVEAGKRKCEQYWPERVGGTISPDGGVSVLLKSVLPFAEYEIRELVLTNPKEPSVSPLKVSQVACLAWPDHGVPANAMSLINFIRRVRKLHPPTHQKPLLIHCSAGVGRTGTFIVLDSMMQRMAAEGSVNIHQFVCQLRTQRPLMVQTVSQYEFIHEALSELVICGETEIEAGSLRIRMHQLQALDSGGTLSGYQQQYQEINELSDDVDPNDTDYSEATLPVNMRKNRYKSKLPCGYYRVRLPHTPDSEEGEDYINASHVHGYRAWNAYIATQGPLKKTTGDFWRMVLERGSRCIVMLCRLTEGGKEACHCYWPGREGGSVDFEGLTVTLRSEQDRGDYVIRKLEVAAGVGSSLSVTQFHYTAWPGPSNPPSSPSSLLELLEEVIKVQQTTGNKTITVMCNDGVGRTGTFICLHAQLERLKTEGAVDFFQYIKSARIHRAGLVDCVEQYIFCHDSVAHYLDSFDTYANFKELV